MKNLENSTVSQQIAKFGPQKAIFGQQNAIFGQQKSKLGQQPPDKITEILELRKKEIWRSIWEKWVKFGEI